MRRVKVVAEVVMDAYWRLAEDDGWAIASHLAMSTLTSMFPFLIFVTALAGFVGSTDLSEAAANLFHLLREADRTKPTAIAVAPIPEHGLGEAINDRLRRSAGFVG